LFCISSDYTPEAITAMRNNPNTNRREATEQLLEAAGAKLVAMYGRTENGPGTLVIFECNDATWYSPSWARRKIERHG
jgi:uncharacterized protein with GYD domain